MKTLSELAALVCGVLVSETNSERTEIQRAVPFSEATPGTITLLDDLKKLGNLSQCRASAVVLPKSAAKKFEEDGFVKWNPQGVALLLCDSPYDAFSKIVSTFNPSVSRPSAGIHPRAFVDETAEIGKNVTISSNVVVGAYVKIGENVILHPNVCLMEGVEIGPNCVIFPNVTIYERCILGARCILHAGVVIGAYGFGYNSDTGRHLLAPQLGNVEIADDVEIGANSTVDRGTFGSTRIGEGTKIDDLVMIAHNCQIGRHNLFCSQVGIAGSCVTGDYVVCAGQVGLADHISIASHVIIGAQAGVPGNISESGTYLGTPAIHMQEMKHQFVAMKQLPEYWKTLKKLAKNEESQKNS